MAIRPISGTLAQETAKYTEWGWSSVAATRTPNFDFGALPDLPSSVLVHSDTENDDLYQTLAMARRTSGAISTEYLNRAALWAAYFKDIYAVRGLSTDFYGDMSGFGGDHVYGWGLIDYSFYTGNSAYLDAAKVIGNFLINGIPSGTTPYASTAYVPGSLTSPAAIVGDGTPRRFGRNLMLMTELAAAGAGSQYATVRDKMVAIAMQDPGYNATLGIWTASQGPTAETLMGYWGPTGTGTLDRGAGTITQAQANAIAAAGLKYVSTFQVPIIIEALRRVIETATFPISYTQGATTYGPYSAQDLKNKIIEAGRFWYDYATHPTRLYTGEVILYGYDGSNTFTGDVTDVYDVWYGLHTASPTVFFTDGRSYTHCGINILMLAAAYIEQTNATDPRVANFRARAKLLWNRSSKAKRIEAGGGSGASSAIVFGNGTSTLGDDRLVLDTQIGRYLNADYDTAGGVSTAYFASNAGEWPYVDLLFGTVDLGTGSWRELSGSTMNSQWPTYDGGGASCIAGHTIGTNGPTSLYANGGLAYDSLRNELFAFGGGHANYSGNETYAFKRSTGLWERRSSPSAAVASDSEFDPKPDGQPNSRHTGNTMVFIPQDKNGAAVNKVFVCGCYGQWRPVDGGALTAWLWDPATASWQRKNDPPVGNLFYNYTGYYNGYVYVLGQNASNSALSGLYRYDVTNDSYTFLQNTLVHVSTGCFAIDTFRGHAWFLQTGSGGKMYRWDLTAASPTATEIAITGDTSTFMGGGATNPGMFYDPTFDTLILWFEFSADLRTIYSMNMQTGVWTAITGSGTTPVADTDVNNKPYVHTRFQIASDGKYLLHVQPNANVFEYSPTASSPPPTSPPTFTFSYHGRTADQVRGDFAPAGLTQDTVLDHVFSLKLATGEPSVSVSALRIDGQQGGSWRTNSLYWPIGVSQTYNTPPQNASNGDINPLQYDGGNKFYLYISDLVPSFYATTGVTLYITIGSSTYTYTSDLTILPINEDPPPVPTTKKFRRIRST